MQNEKNPGNIDQEGLQLVLEEMTKEQQLNSKTINDLIEVVNGLTVKFSAFEETLTKPKEISVTVDSRPVHEIVRKGLTDIRLIAAGQPKLVVRKFQILLFPEQDAKLFYKIVFGRWFLWLTVMLFLTVLYKYGIHWNDTHARVEQLKKENDRIKRAWDILYKSANKGTKRAMDTAYLKTVK